MAENVELRWMPTQSQASLREKYDNNVEWVALSLHSSSIVQHLPNLSQRVERGPVNQDDNAVGADFGDAASVNASHYYLSLAGAVDPDCYSRPDQNQIVYTSDTLSPHSAPFLGHNQSSRSAYPLFHRSSPLQPPYIPDFTDSTQSARSFAPNSLVPSTANPSLLRFTPTQPVHASWLGLPPGFRLEVALAHTIQSQVPFDRSVTGQHREEIDSKDVREHLKEHHGVKLAASDPNAQCLWSGCTVSQQYTSPVLVKHVELLTFFHFHNVDFHGPTTAEVKSQINRRDGEIGGYVEYNTRLSVLSVEWKQGPHIRDAIKTPCVASMHILTAPWSKREPSKHKRGAPLVVYALKLGIPR
ncbi:hypothetical protein C8J57DRAFT_1472130 [Mycena rebaudengoi]|nr:hypothetical protein C8J57DRAFT_1472130 [Mycena rebaudengoi]